jgi:hypothetical protein
MDSPDLRSPEGSSATGNHGTSPASDRASARHDFGSANSHVTIILPNQPAAMTPSGTPVLNPRSCVTCRRRKVRCDKQMPCSNCRRAQTPCIFPAPGRAPRRPRPKDPNAVPKNSSEREVELMKRLRKLEGIVEELSGQIEVESGSGRQPSTAGNSPEGATESTSDRISSISSLGGGHTKSLGTPQGDLAAVAKADAPYPPPQRMASDLHTNIGRLVLHDKGEKRYVSSVFWSKLNDEVRISSEE